MDELDWRWLKSFVAVAREGGMLAASRATRISQPTLSRHISALEEALDVTLFDRSGRGVRLSEQGAALFERAEAISMSVKAFELQALGLSEETAGAVRVTMSELLGTYFAPAWLDACRQDMPHISVDLVLEDSPVDLLMREAEIAVRMFRPHQTDLITRPCGAHVYGFYASPDYVARRGQPDGIEELRGHDLIGYDRRTAWLENAARMGFTFTREDFVTRTDSEPMHPRLAAAGLGICAIGTWVGDQLGLTRLLPEYELAGQPVFLTAHQSSRQNPRVARVWRHLGDALDARFGGTTVALRS